MSRLKEIRHKTKNEVWKLIPGFRNYRISNLGNIQTKGRWGNTWKNKWSDFDKHGYKRTVLWKDGVMYNKKIHILVLSSFVPRPKGKVVCHNNGKKNDNRLENLRWDTLKANSQDKKKHNTQPFGEKNPLSKLTEKQVLEIRKRFKKKNQTVSNRKELAEIFGVHVETISNIAKRRFWKHVK